MAQNSRIGELDAIRGFAALVIVVCHICLSRWSNFLLDLAPAVLYLFFLISGVVIAQSMEQSSGRGHFLRKRFKRIMPTYVPAVLFTSALLVVHHLIWNWPITDITWRALSNLTLFEHFFGVRYIDGSYWTLTVEVAFYLFVALLWKRVWTLGVFVMAALGVVLVCFPQSYIHHVIGFYLPQVVFFPLFTAGYLFRKIYLGERSFTVHVAILLTCLWQLLLLPESPLHKFIALEHHAAVVLLGFVLFYAVCLGHMRFLSNRITRYLGELSYPLYLIHHFVVFFVLMPVLQDKWKLPFFLAAVLCLAVVVLLAEALRRVAHFWQHKF
jgi:peptidoglycan/LPS O-acetylase OafA/YrhL